MKHQILLIDDSPTIYPLVNAILANEPVNIHSAKDPAYGLVLAASVRPDLILLDVDMPGMTGFEACQKLKANPETADCPVIFLTGHSAPQRKVEGFGLGAVDYVTKPFVPTELLARVRASLRTQRSIRLLEAKMLTDPLTGLWNRQMFNQRLNAEIGLRSRTGSPLSITMIDIDFFKKVNDLYGHLSGDEVLQGVAKIVKSHCRVEDVPCRFGGEEFAVISPHTDAHEAGVLAERIRRSVADARFSAVVPSGSALTGQTVRVTASLGVAAAADPHDRSMLQRSDEAMYQAKDQGRNQVVVFPPASARLRAAA